VTSAVSRAPTATGSAALTPASALANRRWTKHLHPYPHYTAENVFKPAVYKAFASAFREEARRRQYMDKHDTYGVTLTRGLEGPLSFFASRGWREMIVRLLGIPATRHLNIGLHHHEPGSENGFVHNDLNPGWFVDYESADGTVLAQPDLCSYTSGETTGAGVTARQTIRAAALLFYLANPPWTPGDGGETGIYRCGSDAPERPLSAVPPVNNSILLFECTPWSFHGFIRNRRAERNSLVMWWHREPSDVARRWGADAVVDYR